MADKDDLGRAGERYARQWLQRRGWAIVDANWRCRQGEIDIVASRGKELVFFEVKTRSSTRFGYPVEAISSAKLARLRRLVGLWLADHPHHRGRIRLDLIGIITGGPAPIVQHVEGIG